MPDEPPVTSAARCHCAYSNRGGTQRASRASPSAAAARRSTRPRGSRSCSRASCRRRRRISSSGSTPPTTRPSTGSTTSARSSSRSTSSRRSSTTRAIFGAIAATNALNDVFAMGGLPLLALSVAAFPEELATEVVAAIFAGADEQVPGGGRDPRGRPHDPRRRAEVRARRGRHRPPGRPSGVKSGARARRRALPDEAARHGRSSSAREGADDPPRPPAG